ncbi:hypothetical protein [Spirosoma oryzicola]|uniref:hypothetical protein n=1 Tax=Spirosoma oryzicola TaxID=2898794 RepID=UPI001E5FAD6D|nr:hypothetical protein [Spirosoma oryzicola]UHG93412.1 hypothetical protein LQ777_11020 [Spirosoma oryzicola]
MPNVNPLERLLDALPAAIAKEKRASIQADLVEVGLWEHYRQTISKPGKDLGRISFRAGVIFKHHLGVSDDFFVGSAEVQEDELKRIVRLYFDTNVSVT